MVMVRGEGLGDDGGGGEDGDDGLHDWCET